MSVPAASAARVLAPPRPRPLAADRIARALGIVFFLATTGLAVAQHLTFHTRARDMGIYVQALWSAAQGRPFVTTLLQENTNHLAEHVAPALWPLVPLAGLVPDAVPLLIIQQAFLAGCAVPVYLMARMRLLGWQSLLVLLGFLLMPAISRVSLSEFHPIVMAALPVTTGIAVLLSGRPRAGALLLLASLLVEEEAAPTVVGVGAMLLLCSIGRLRCHCDLSCRSERSEESGTRRWAPPEPSSRSPKYIEAIPSDNAIPPQARMRPRTPDGTRLATFLIVVGTVWAFLVVAAVLPGFRLPVRGESTNRAAAHFEQVHQDPGVVANWIVGERGPDVLSWLVLPHGGLALAAPEVLLATLPGFVVLFLQDRTGTYAGHWAAPLLPIVWLAVGVGWGRLRGRCLDRIAPLLLLVGAAAAYRLDSYLPGGREFEADHYYNTALESDLGRAARLVPPGASFVGTRRVVPHLTARRDLFQFPFSFYSPPLRPDSQRPEFYILDLTDSPTRRAVEPSESDSVLEKRPRYNVRRFGGSGSVLLLSKARPTPLLARGETFGGQVRLVGLDWLDRNSSPIATPAPDHAGPLVRLYWEAAVRPTVDATRALRLVGTDGRTTVEDVGQPLGEYLPLRDWERGQAIVEELGLPPGSPNDPSGFRLLVGWRGPDGRPLPLDGGGGPELELAHFERR